MVLLMMNATTVSARTRFNDLGNKLKSKAEKVVDDKKREVKGQVTLSSGNTAEAFDYNKKYAPSAEVSLNHLRPAPKRRRDAKVDTLCSTRITNIKVEIYLVCRHFFSYLCHMLKIIGIVFSLACIIGFIFAICAGVAYSFEGLGDTIKKAFRKIKNS